MSYNIFTIPPFDKQLKRLSRKYPSIKNDYAELLQELSMSPEPGTPLGNNCFKIRMSIASKGKGKSGGARVIAHVKRIKESVYLLSIYDKSEQDSLPDSNLQELLKYIP